MIQKQLSLVLNRNISCLAKVVMLGWPFVNLTLKKQILKTGFLNLKLIFTQLYEFLIELTIFLNLNYVNLFLFLFVAHFF